jgi:hypothetical protein
MAVSDCEPSGKELVDSVATPALNVPVPIRFAPFIKDTVPVGVPVAAVVTVAVSVRLCPMATLEAEAVKVVVVGVLPTGVPVSVTTFEPAVAFPELLAIDRVPVAVTPGVGAKTTPI